VRNLTSLVRFPEVLSASAGPAGIHLQRLARGAIRELWSDRGTPIISKKPSELEYQWCCWKPLAFLLASRMHRSGFVLAGASRALPHQEWRLQLDSRGEPTRKELTENIL